MLTTILGYLGPSCPFGLRKAWNDALTGEGRDAFFDFYPCRILSDLQLRLSEMYLLDRRGYVIGKGLEGDSLTLMDRLDETAVRANAVDTVVNRGGVLHGYCVGAMIDKQPSRQCLELFLR